MYQYCLKLWYLSSLEHASVIQKLTILEHKNGLVLSNTRVPVSRTWSILFPNCRLHSWTLYKSADCRWPSTTILCVSFTNSATVGRLEQVQLCNRLIDQSADNITGLKCAKECLIVKYKYIQNPWLYTLPLVCSKYALSFIVQLEEMNFNKIHFAQIK